MEIVDLASGENVYVLVILETLTALLEEHLPMGKAYGFLTKMWCGLLVILPVCIILRAKNGN